MDLLKIKNLVKQNGDKFIFVENGEPEIVMMSFKEYEKLAQNGGHGQAYPGVSGRDQYEPTIFDFEETPKETEVISPFVAEAIGLPVRLEDIHLEDLPI